MQTGFQTAPSLGTSRAFAHDFYTFWTGPALDADSFGPDSLPVRSQLVSALCVKLAPCERCRKAYERSECLRYQDYRQQQPRMEPGSSCTSPSIVMKLAPLLAASNSLRAAFGPDKDPCETAVRPRARQHMQGMQIQYAWAICLYCTAWWLSETVLVCLTGLLRHQKDVRW